MIGKKVIFYFRSETVNGTVVGQYRHWEENDDQVPSGQGGFIILPQKIGVDYFLIQGEDGNLYHIKCSKIMGLV